jgi:hypothetical protein
VIEIPPPPAFGQEELAFQAWLSFLVVMFENGLRVNPEVDNWAK